MSSSDTRPPDRVTDLIANSIAADTRRAYASDLAQFEALREAFRDTVMVAAYLAAHAEARIHIGPTFWRVDRMVVSLRAAIGVAHRQRTGRLPHRTDLLSDQSLRVGFATSAAQAAVSTLKLRSKSADAMLARYVRDGELFADNAAGALL
jgi:hypothetical protein